MQMVQNPLYNNNSPYYNGNENILKAGVKQKITPTQKAEILKCKTDILYFIENYVKIITLDHGLQLFKPYDFQRELLEVYDNNRFVISLQSRQMGKTISSAAYVLYKAIFNKEIGIAILANKEAQSKEILERIKRMYENLPKWLQVGIKEWNKTTIHFGHDTKITAAATSSDSIRGKSFNIIYLDEFAFVQAQDEFYTSTYPVISSGNKSQVIITSTPNGYEMFHKMWMDAKNKVNKYYPYQVDWHQHPNRDQKWYEDTLANIGEKRFAQEFGNSFHGSSDTLFDGNTLAKLAWEVPLKEDDKLRVYENPIEGHIYVATIDVSEGVGLDSSVINITDVTEKPFRQVAVWRDNKTNPLVLPEIANKLGIEYNNAFILVETNSVGSIVANSLWNDYEYENMIVTTVDAQENKVTAGFSGRIDIGLRMTKKSKRIGCTNIKALVEDDIYIIVDHETVLESQTFIKKGQSYEASDGNHDDIMMTLVHFGWLSTQDFFTDLNQLVSRDLVMQKNQSLIDDELTPFGFMDTGIDGDGELIDDDYIFDPTLLY